MKIKISSIIGKEYTNNKITKEIIVEHGVQNLIWQESSRKELLLNTLRNNPDIYINIQELADRIEWDYVHEQEFINVETLEELLKLVRILIVT